MNEICKRCKKSETLLSNGLCKRCDDVLYGRTEIILPRKFPPYWVRYAARVRK